MPSERSPAGRGAPDRAEEYDVDRMIEDHGEDPGRWLDRDLFGHGISRLEPVEDAGYREDDQRLVRDSDVSAPGELIRDRIAGIDKIAVARAWRAVERALPRTPDGGRAFVIDLIEDRIDDLEADGERELPGHDPGMLRSLGVEKFENTEKGDVVYRGPDGEVTSRTEGSSASQKLAAIADGGDGE